MDRDYVYVTLQQFTSPRHCFSLIPLDIYFTYSYVIVFNGSNDVFNESSVFITGKRVVSSIEWFVVISSIVDVLLGGVRRVYVCAHCVRGYDRGLGATLNDHLMCS